MNKGSDDEHAEQVPEEPREMRKSPRFPLEGYEVVLWKKTLLSRIGIGRKNLADDLLNLSSGGSRLIVNGNLKQTSTVMLRVRLPKFDDVLEVEGKIVQIHHVKGTQAQQEIGIEFSNLTPKQTTLIRNMERWFSSEEFRKRHDRKQI